MNSLPRNRCGAGFPALLLVASCAGAVGCSGDGVIENRPRAVVIGIDGADWKIVDALTERGELPHLQSLRDRGVSARIRTLPDIPLSPVIWTSVATGKTATKHGVSWFMVDQADGQRAPVRSHNRRTKAIWNILAEHGLEPAVIGWWATYPAEDVADGVIVSDALGFHGFGATARDGEDTGKVYPPSRFAQLDALVPPDRQISFDFARRFLHISSEEYGRERYDPARHPRRHGGNPIHLFQMYAATAQGYTAIAERLLDEPYDLLMVYFEQVDSLSHLFMKYAPPRLEWVDDAGFARYRDAVSEWYRYQDELLGRLLARIDLDSTAVFVVADHGFKSGERRIRSERVVDVQKAHLDHETHGVFIAAGPGIRRGEELDELSVLDVTPTMLHYLDLPVAKDMDGRVAEFLFDPGFVSAHPIRYVQTYETDARPAAGSRLVEGLAPEELADRIQALQSLGYVGSGPSLASSDDTAAATESSPEIHNNLGRVHLARGELAEAQREFERALELDPDNAEALIRIGSVERARGSVAEAERYIERALQVDPDSITALCELAEIKRDRGELDESIRLYREALSINDSHPFVYVGLGDSLQRAGRLDEAERTFLTVLELDPDSFEAHYNLGVTRLNQGRVADAETYLERALELNPEHVQIARVYNNLGDILLGRGDVEGAARRFRQAIDASPVQFESRYNLAVVHLGAGKLDEAIELLEEAARLQPNQELVAMRLGLAYLQAGRNAEARRSLLLVVRLYPRNWIARLGLGAIYFASGDSDRARTLVGEAIEIGGEAARAEAARWPGLEGLLPG